MLADQIRQCNALLTATERAAEKGRLFAAHIYEEDKEFIQTKILIKLNTAQSIMKQCKAAH